jgi:hypothetical protein
MWDKTTKRGVDKLSLYRIKCKYAGLFLHNNHRHVNSIL